MSAIASPVELRRRALEILVRELGYSDAMRFMLQYESGSGDYTRDRDSFLPDWTPEALFQEADFGFKRRTQAAPPGQV